MKRLALCLLLLSQFVSAQNEKKIDSVFQHYFKVIETELKKDNLMNYPSLYEEVELGNGERGFTNKYLAEAINFLEDITKIEAPKEKRGINVVSMPTDPILVKWQSWYDKNKEDLCWNKRQSKPKMSFWKRVF